MDKKKIELMHEIFGSGHPSDKCKTCRNLKHHFYHGRSYYKCSVYGETDSEASDWRLKYPSCGMYNMSYDGYPIIKIKKHSGTKKPEIQCEGQVSIFDEGM